MSVKYSSKVWEDTSIKKHSDLVLMLAIADHANDDGIAWPGLSSLGRKTRMSRRTIQRAIDRMSKSGKLVIEQEGRGRATSLYRVVYDTGVKLTPPPDLRHRSGVKLTPQGRQCDTGGGVTVTPQRCHSCDTQTISESSIEPSNIRVESDGPKRLIHRFRAEFPDTYCVTAPKQVLQELQAARQMLASGETEEVLVKLAQLNAKADFAPFRGQSATLGRLQQNLASIKARLNGSLKSAVSDGRQMPEKLELRRIAI